MAKVLKALFFSNGNVAAFGSDDQQLRDLQRRSLYELWADHATREGFNVEGCHITAPDATYVIDRTANGWRLSRTV